MAGISDIQSELGGLRDDLSAGAQRGAGEHASGSEGHPHIGDELAAAIGELKSMIEDASEDAEALVARYPLAAVAAAFVLGVVAGRIMGHRST